MFQPHRAQSSTLCSSLFHHVLYSLTASVCLNLQALTAPRYPVGHVSSRGSQLIADGGGSRERSGVCHSRGALCGRTWVLRFVSSRAEVLEGQDGGIGDVRNHVTRNSSCRLTWRSPWLLPFQNSIRSKRTPSCKQLLTIIYTWSAMASGPETV